MYLRRPAHGVLDHLQRVCDLTEEDVNYVKEYIQELDIQDILVLQVMEEEEEGFDDIGNEYSKICSNERAAAESGPILWPLVKWELILLDFSEMKK